MSTTALSASFTTGTMTSGDCLVVERADGLFEVYKVLKEGARHLRDTVTDRERACQIARVLLSPDGETVYFKVAGEPDSAIRPHIEDQGLPMVYA
jgi:hypothetical protein